MLVHELAHDRVQRLVGDEVAARRGRPVVVRVKARDRTSGVSAMQIASAKSPGAKVLPFRAQARAVVAGSRTWVRVRDGAGNWSGWRRAG